MKDFKTLTYDDIVSMLSWCLMQQHPGEFIIKNVEFERHTEDEVLKPTATIEVEYPNHIKPWIEIGSITE